MIDLWFAQTQIAVIPSSIEWLEIQGSEKECYSFDVATTKSLLPLLSLFLITGRCRSPHVSVESLICEEEIIATLIDVFFDGVNFLCLSLIETRMNTIIQKFFIECPLWEKEKFLE